MFGIVSTTGCPGCGSHNPLQHSGVCPYGNWQSADALYRSAFGSLNLGLGAQLTNSQAASYIQQQQALANAYGLGIGGFISGMGGTEAPPASPPDPLERDGIKVGEIIGWRIWRVNHGYLMSFGMDEVWPPDEPMTGTPGDHDYCGVWAFKTKRMALKKMVSNGNNHAYGSVAMWGEVVEHELGYRAEFAKVISINDLVQDIPIVPSFSTMFLRKLNRAPALSELRQKYLSPSSPQHR